MSDFKLEDLPLTPLDEDGSIRCRNCGKRIHFLPEESPLNEAGEGAPRSVNHSGCPNAVADESPAGPDAHSGLHETINRIDPDQVRAFYHHQAPAQPEQQPQG